MPWELNNRKRAFAEVVTVEAWHEPFGLGRAKVDLHADVVFGTARVGGESDSPVRFRLSVRRAEVVVVIPQFEPVSVDIASVSRDAPEQEGHLTRIIEDGSLLNAKASASGSISASGISAAAAASADAELRMASSAKLEMSSAVRLIAVTQSRTSEGHYRWALRPRASSFLEGRPWGALSQPRLKLVDKRGDLTKGIPPTVRVEVWCRKEDLKIEDLVVKDQNLWEKIRGRTGFQNRLAAAESYIRARLAEEGLEVKNFNDIFGHVTLASTTAESN